MSTGDDRFMSGLLAAFGGCDDTEPPVKIPGMEDCLPSRVLAFITISVITALATWPQLSASLLLQCPDNSASVPITRSPTFVRSCCTIQSSSIRRTSRTFCTV